MPLLPLLPELPSRLAKTDQWQSQSCSTGLMVYAAILKLAALGWLAGRADLKQV